MHSLIRSSLCKSYSTISQNGAAAGLLSSSPGLNLINSSNSRQYRVDYDHSNYGGVDGKELRFNHDVFMRPMKECRFGKIKQKQKFNHVIYYNLEERLREIDPKIYDPELHKRINIGYSIAETESSSEKKRRQRKSLMELKTNKELQKLTKSLKWRINVSDVQKNWLSQMGPAHKSRLASHSGIFNDTYGPHAYFNPIVPLVVEYDFDDQTFSPVFNGNIIKPKEAQSAPQVAFPSPSDTLWTLKLINPDGDLYKKDSECIHWLVTNIKGNDISTGETLVPYLAPVPPRGVGYQRMVFLLYRQDRPMTETEQYSVADANDLRQRSFSTKSFYQKNEDNLTPCGLAWYNTDWDDSLTHFYHKVLGMKEPIYEYEFPAPYIKEEVALPEIDRDFSFYLDMHRTKEDINEEMLLKKLQRINPYKKQTKLPYPDTMPINHNLPSWVRQRIMRERRGWGQFKELYSADKFYDTTEDEDSGLKHAAEVEVDKKHMQRLGVEWKRVHYGIKTSKKLVEKEKSSV